MLGKSHPLSGRGDNKVVFPAWPLPLVIVAALHQYHCRPMPARAPDQFRHKLGSFQASGASCPPNVGQMAIALEAALCVDVVAHAHVSGGVALGDCYTRRHSVCVMVSW